MVQMALRAKVNRARSYWRALLAAEGTLWTLAALLAAFLVSFHLDRWLVLTLEARVAVWAVLGVLFSGCSLWLILRPVLQPRSAEDVAAMVERRYPHLRERLLSAVEFANTPGERLRGVSAALLTDIQADAEREAGGIRFEKAFRANGVGRSGTAFGLTALFLGLHLLLAGPAFGAFLSRMALGSTPVWRDTRVQVDPLRTKILKGADFAIGIDQEGKAVDRARLRFQFGDGAWNSVDLKADGQRHFGHLLKNVTETVTYYATAGDGVTDRGVAQVVDPAAVVGAKLTLDYPAYMDRKPVSMVAESGGVAAPVGTRVGLELKANKPLEQAQATLPKAKPVDWTVDGETITGALTVRDNGAYSLRLKDQDGFFAPEAQSFPIKAIPDQTPEVQLLEPEGDLDVVPDARVKLHIAARDDYGVARVHVPYAVEGRAGTLPAGAGGKHAKTLELESLWDLATLRVKPGDTVRFRIEATDWDNVSGPHTGKTAEYQLRIIDQGEAERRYQEQRGEILRQLGELIKEQKGTRAETDAQRSASRMSPENLSGTEDRQRSAASTAQDLARRIAEMNRMAETNNLAQKPELDGQKSAQQGLNKLSQDQMPQAANRIGSAQAQAQSNPQSARGELGQASQQQGQILEELQRIAQQMKPASELQRLAERFERLAKEQRSLQGQTDQMLPQTLGKALNELSPQQRASLQQNAQAQQSLQRATTQAMADLDRAAQGMQSPEQADAAQQTAEGLRQGQVTEQQSGAAQSAQQNSLGQARSQQEQAARELEQAARQLRDAQNPDDPRSLQRQLRQAANRLNRMMQQHQDAVQQSKGAMSAQQQRELAQQQKELERQARELARQLQRLQRRAPSAAQAAQAMQEAGAGLSQSSQALSQGQQSQAQQSQQKAMQAMQRAMQSLQQAQAEAEQENDPFAQLRKELDKLANQQRAIAQATRRVDEEQGRRGARPDDAAELKRLAQGQSAVESATAKLEPELPGEVFKAFAQSARKAMDRSREGLDGGNPKADPTQRSQQRALTILDQLKRSLDADDKDNSQGQGGGGEGGQGGGGGGAPDPELPKRIAEIRLLRFMEQAIKNQTQDVDDARRDSLSEEQKAQIDEAARQQASAKSLAERVSKGLARYRSLAGKVSQAGKHMGEAQRGLDKGDTGEVTQEQEQQSIIQLTQALRQAQQQAQSQSQAQSRRPQPGRQPGQQPGPPAPGTQQGNGQGGSSPALRSLARRSGSQGGALGGYGPDARGFTGLDPRSQDALRQSYKEKVPAEYQDLINRYYKALSDKGR